MAALLIGVRSSTNRRAGWQNGYWAPKITLWLGLLVTSFFIPNQFFITYGNYVALIGAAIFVLLQLILLIDFAHAFSLRLIENYEMSESRSAMVTLVTFTLGLLSVGIVLTGIMYGFFAGPQCKLNQFFVTFNLLLCLGACLLSIAPVIQNSNPRSGLTQVSIVVAYATYLVLSAVANEPIANSNEATCNPIGATGGSRTASIVVGAIFTFVAIMYSTTTAAIQGQRMLGHDTDPDAIEAAVPLLQAIEPVSSLPTDPALRAAVEAGALPASALQGATATLATNNNPITTSSANPTVVVIRAGPTDQYPTEDEAQGVAYNYSFFHVVFALASMYLAMLVTSWNAVTVVGHSVGENDGLLVEINKSWAAVWVKIVSGWLVIGLYLWTLIGPVVLTDREWS